MRTRSEVYKLRQYRIKALIFNSVQYGSHNENGEEWGIKIGWDNFISQASFTQACDNLFDNGIEYILFSNKF